MPEEKTILNVTTGTSVSAFKDFTKQDVKGNDFRNQNIFCTNFKDVDLSNCKFEGSILYGCNFEGAKFEGSDLRVYTAENWSAYIFRDKTTIGCLTLKNITWKLMPLSRVAKLAGTEAARIWEQNKEEVFKMMDSLI